MERKRERERERERESRKAKKAKRKLRSRTNEKISSQGRKEEPGRSVCNKRSDKYDGLPE